MNTIIIFDFYRTLYDPDIEDVMPDSLMVLKSLWQSDFELILITRKEHGRPELIESLGIDKYFSQILQVNEKASALSKVMKSYPERSFVVIGDRAHEEIVIGNKLGAKTIWLQAGKFASELPESFIPTHTVHLLKEILPLCLR
jgi:FMN phosphatase YigB (HAD superfamily)